jgi:hypothetical protein
MMTGYAGDCSGGRGFETSQASYGGEVDANMTFVLSGNQDSPTLSVFPVQNSYSLRPCAGRIAVVLRNFGSYGVLLMIGEYSQKFIYIWDDWFPFNYASYTIRLKHSFLKGQSTGYLYGPTTKSEAATLIASTPPLGEFYSSSLKIGVVESNGPTSISSVGVNGINLNPRFILIYLTS